MWVGLSWEQTEAFGPKVFSLSLFYFTVDNINLIWKVVDMESRDSYDMTHINGQILQP